MKIGFLDTKKTAQAGIGEFWAQKNSTGPHRGILGTKKPAEAGIEEFWAQKKPAEAGCVDGAP